ncbi:MAG: glycosyltransferase family 4 protein [Leptolyngbya sp. IPPAS B-1204]
MSKEGNAFRQAYGLEDKFVVMYSGNIALTQGLETVIRAAAQLQHIPEIVIVVVGEKQALSALRQTCEAYGVHNVLLLPFQPREQLPEMLAAADVGLVVQKRNVISFNMPSKIQVLLASGRPIIASVPLTGTAARAIRQSGGGVVVEPEQPEVLAAAVQDLYLNPAKANTLGQQGRAYATQHYSFDKALSRYEELFYDVISPSGSPAKALPQLTTDKSVADAMPIELQ